MPEFRELLEQRIAADPFQVLYDHCRGKLGRRGYKAVYMVVLPDLTQVNGETLCGADLPEQSVQPGADLRGKDLPPVFDAPDNMVMDVVYAGPCVYIIFLHTDSIT